MMDNEEKIYDMIINLTAQNGMILEKLSNMEKWTIKFETELARIEKMNVELATRADLKAIADKVRATESDISNLKSKPEKDALDREKKIKGQLLTITVGLVGLALVGGVLLVVANQLIANLGGMIK